VYWYQLIYFDGLQTYHGSLTPTGDRLKVERNGEMLTFVHTMGNDRGHRVYHETKGSMASGDTPMPFPPYPTEYGITARCPHCSGTGNRFMGVEFSDRGFESENARPGAPVTTGWVGRYECESCHAYFEGQIGQLGGR
jgi:hypothetical protein